MQRVVEGPDHFWLDDHQFAEYLGIPSGTFKAQVRRGVIPPPKRHSRQTKLWSWRTVFWVSEGIELGYIKLYDGPDDSDNEDEN